MILPLRAKYRELILPRTSRPMAKIARFGAAETQHPLKL